MSITYRVCDCPEVCGCYAERYAQGKDKAYFEMSNFDWTQHAKDCGCEPGDQGNADRDTRTDQPASAGTWLACFESTGISDSYGVVRGK